MIRLCHEARRRLKNGRRSAAVIGAARLITGVGGLLAALLLRKLLLQEGYLPANSLTGDLNADDIFLTATLLTALLAFTPLHIQTAWQLGRLSGTLDDNDLGFLAHSSSLWLWSKAILLRLLMQMLMLLAACPTLLLYVVTKSIWMHIPPEEEGLLPLLTVLHLGILSIAACYLPLRVYAANTALPFCYLKMPHESPLRILRMCFRFTRAQTLSAIAMRLMILPALLFPFTAVEMLPTLLTAEQIRCERVWRHQGPRRRSRFWLLELHAYEPAADP